MARLLLCLVSFMALSCGHSHSPSKGSDQPQRLVLSGMVLRADADPLVGLAVYDAEILFHLAGEAHRQGKPELARRIYEKLVEEFASSPQAAPSRFNLGRLAEERHDFRAASMHYDALSADENLPKVDRRLYLDSFFRKAVCLGALADYWQSVAVFDQVLELDDLDDFDRLEAMVGRGIAMHEAGENDSADVAFAHALRFHREADQRQRWHDHGLAAEAAFRMGVIATERFENVLLEFPVELLKSRLEEKCQALLSAQSRYLRSIYLGDRHTAAAAGFRIGSLYESLYESIVGVEAPSELDEEQTEVYHDEVHRRVSVLLKKAIMIYEKSLLVGRPAASAAVWVSRIETALERLKMLYLKAIDPERR